MSVCPFDETYKANPCTCVECPYHFSKSTYLFNYEDPVTQCSLIDLNLKDTIYDTSPLATLTKSDRHNPSVNYRSLRRNLELALKSAKLIYVLTTEVPDEYCTTCGHPTCSGGKLCSDRAAWAKEVLSSLNLPHLPILLANVWSLFYKGQLTHNDAVLLRQGNRLKDSKV